MATTTNYGWTTPDDTALVKDGASAIRSLGSSIDTTTKNLNPSTTLGDLEYRSSTSNTNTRIPIGTSGQGLQVVGGVPAWAASSTSTLTTTGDLLYASAANTLARRAIGSTGDVLTVSGGLPTWAAPSGGSYTSLASGTLSSTSVVLSSINQTYRQLVLVVSNPVVNTGTPLALRINSSASAYLWCAITTGNTAVLTNTARTYFWPNQGNMPTASDTKNLYVIYFPEYALTTGIKSIFSYSYNVNDAPTLAFGTSGSNQDAISSITISGGNGTSTFSSGTYTLYGVK